MLAEPEIPYGTKNEFELEELDLKTRIGIEFGFGP